MSQVPGMPTGCTLVVARRDLAEQSLVNIVVKEARGTNMCKESYEDRKIGVIWRQDGRRSAAFYSLINSSGSRIWILMR